MKVWNRFLIALLILVVIPFYWLLIDARTGGVPAQKIDLGQLRQAAQAISGPKPTGIEYAPVAARRMVGAAFVAGGGLKPDLIGVVAFRLATPGGDTVIESGVSRAQAVQLQMHGWNARAQIRVNHWLVGARRILFTHEHLDHVGGYLASPEYVAIAKKAVIRPEMVKPIAALAGKGAGLLPGPIVYGDFAAVAPGVVLLRTPGHTPGSQMIYVQLQDGREYLFTGDTASMARNVSWLRPRSHLISDWIMPEDRPATIGWLKALSDLSKREPHVTLVYSHDLAWLQSDKRGPHFHTDFPFRMTADDRSPDDGPDAADLQDGPLPAP